MAPQNDAQRLPMAMPPPQWCAPPRRTQRRSPPAAANLPTLASRGCARAVWRSFYYSSQNVVSEFSWFVWTLATCGPGFRRCIDEYEPDMVISLHPLCQNLPLHILRKERRADTPFVTVCTDLGSCHPGWFRKEVDAAYVPSDAIRQTALKRGVAEHKIRHYGRARAPERRPLRARALQSS
jgi:hypothetical protein